MIKEAAQEAVQTARLESAKKMLNDGKLAIEKIAEYSGLTVSEVEILAGFQPA